MVFKTPSRRPPYRSKAPPWSSSPSSTSKPRPEGIFENGGWFCDCDPRLPAVHLQTKKAGANKGRWFFTCQQQRGSQCGFFLWEDAAQAREKDDLANGGKSDIVTTIGRAPAPLPELTPTPIPRQRLFRGVPQQTSPTASRKAHRGGGLFVNDDGDDDGDGDEWEATPPSSGADKRKRIKIEEWDDGDHVETQAQKRRRAADDEFGDLDLGSEEERQLARIADQPTTTTAHHRPRDSWSSTTPSVQGSYDVVGGMTTPVSVRTGPGTNIPVYSAAGTQLKPPPSTRQAGDEMTATPTPARNRDVLSSSSQQQQVVDGDGDYPITNEVMRLLAGQPESTRQAVRDRLNTYALRMLGVERGREMARTALKAKDGRISELQARVESLESERKVSREMMRKLLE
ncbi:hypothetical protein B0T19DRAFT_409423 [Cercophora scortea]|uniref:GRF-type domain-containing protein n=1 Tax=Cercophora scortea TaxID=314031 RepID=A0AAE0J3V3_9PEZI|nr:hypothetical protein B0T19DRAFT_409423 [Cercophora scortea]